MGHKVREDLYLRYKKMLIEVSRKLRLNCINISFLQMESDQLKPELIAVDFSIYGHEITKQSHIDTAVERRGIMSPIERFKRYLHVTKILFKGHFMHKNGLEEQYLEDTFQDYDLEAMETQELFDLITEKSGYHYVQVHQDLESVEKWAVGFATLSKIDAFKNSQILPGNPGKLREI